MAAAAVLDLFKPEIASFDPLFPKTLLRTKHEVDRMIQWPFEFFEMRGRSLVGRQIIIHTYINLIYSLRYVRNVAREE